MKKNSIKKNFEHTLNANSKKLYIFKHLAKIKKFFLPISIILRLIPIEIPKKKSKLKSPCGASANEYSCAHGVQVNFGDLTPYLTYGREVPKSQYL
jgi:hypothetical protein